MRTRNSRQGQFTKLCFPPCIGNHIAKPEVISLLEQGEDPWSVEQAYPQSTCPGEGRPRLGARNFPLSLPCLRNGLRPRSYLPQTVMILQGALSHLLTFLQLLIQSKDGHLINKVTVLMSCIFFPCHPLSWYLSYSLLPLSR